MDYSISKQDTLVIKGFAICAMLWHHLFSQGGDYCTFTLFLAQIGKVCVSLFLFLSGYGITTQYQNFRLKNHTPKESIIDSNTIQFIGKRFIHFYSSYWVIYIIFVPLGHFFFERNIIDLYDLTNTYKNIAKDVLGIAGYQSYNITWWFNKLIIKLWIAFPLLYFLISKLKIAIPLLLFLCTWSFFPCFSNDRDLIEYTFIFSLGIFSSLYIKNINVCCNRIPLHTITFLASIFCILFTLNRQFCYVPFFVGTKMDALLAPLICILFVVINKSFNIKFNPFFHLGKHATNIYLLHTFIQGYYFKDFIYAFRNSILMFAVSLSICFTISIIIEFIKGKFNNSNFIIKLYEKLHLQ